MKMLAKETALFVPIAVAWVCRQSFPLNWKESYLRINLVRISRR